MAGTSILHGCGLFLPRKELEARSPGLAQCQSGDLLGSSRELTKPLIAMSEGAASPRCDRRGGPGRKRGWEDSAESLLNCSSRPGQSEEPLGCWRLWRQSRAPNALFVRRQWNSPTCRMSWAPWLHTRPERRPRPVPRPPSGRAERTSLWRSVATEACRHRRRGCSWKPC